MRQARAWSILAGMLVLASATAVARLAQYAAAQAAGPRLITIDYPSDGTVFPPEITPPTFLFRDTASGAVVWQVEIAFGDRSPTLVATSAGNFMQIGETDPRCITSTNHPVLTPQQTVTRIWTPEAGLWTEMKTRSVARPAALTITGFRDPAMQQAVSRGRVEFQTSKDPVGAPVFYRDVPLMPTEGEQGTIKPLPQQAIGLIKWRLRHIGEPQSRTMMENLPTCANCHSFSLDGKTLGLDVDGPQNDKGLYALVAVQKETVIRNEDVIKWSALGAKLGGKLRAAFSSQVSPDGRYVVTTIEDPRARDSGGRGDLLDKYYTANFKDHRFLQVFYPTRGILAWYSRETGTLQPLPGADDPRFVQTDGVWSPDGKYIVFARAEAKAPYPEGWKPAEYANDPNETQIRYDLYRIPFNGGRGGKPERIAGASENGMSNNFPKVSPDGRWIVYVRCRNGQLMRPDSQLYIVPFAGGRERRMNCNTPLMNSWHSFSPNGRWLVFSSKSRSPFTQMYLTHLDEKGNDTPPVLIENATAANRAVNIPEFVNIPPDGMLSIAPKATDFYRLFDSALELMRRNQIDAAISEWEQAISLNREEAKAYFNLALCLDRKGRLEDAVTQYRQAVILDPQNAAACTNLAVDLARTGRSDEALESLQNCVSASPDNPRARANLGTLLLEKGRVDEALEHCRRAVELDPDYAEGQNILGAALARADKLDEAIPHSEKAVALAPDSFEYRFNLGRFLAARHRFEEAIPNFEVAVVLTRGREVMSLDMLSAMYSEVGKFREAAAAARKALELAVQQNNQELAADLRARLAAYEAKLPQ